MNLFYRFLSIFFLCVYLVTITPATSFARPVTEATNVNKNKLNRYYEENFSRLHQEMGLYGDIPITSPDFADILLLIKSGLVDPKIEDDFYPKSEISDIEFLDWYLILINDKSIKKDTYLKLSTEEKLAHIKSIGHRFTNTEKQFIKTINKESINESTAINLLEKTKTKVLIEKKLTKIKALRLIMDNLKQNKKYEVLKDDLLNYNYPKFNHNIPPNISVSDHYIEVDGEPVKGVFVNWMEDYRQLSKTEIIARIREMKELGIIGVSLEIGWDVIEKKEGEMVFPKRFDELLKDLSEEGMYVHLLLSPHYTPNWVFEKYSTDIRMVDIYGDAQDEGEYATFSYFSPAVDDQISFQKGAVGHYASFPNVLTILLGNEQSYGRTNDLDYSVWAKKAWQEYQMEIGLPLSDIPKSANDGNWIHWKRFRQVGLNNFFNKVYKEVKKVQKRVPLSSKYIPYENTSAFSTNYGLHLSPHELKMDFLATDIYGFTPNTYALQDNFDMPKIVIETNLPGDWEEANMYKYLVLNYMKGVPIQSVFAWVKGEFENALFHDDGSQWQKTAALKSAAMLIQNIDMPIQDKFETAIIIPTNGLNMEGDLFRKYQYRIDDIVDRSIQKNRIKPVIIWSTDLRKEDMKEFKEIIILESKYDQEYAFDFNMDTQIFTIPEGVEVLSVY